MTRDKSIGYKDGHENSRRAYTCFELQYLANLFYNNNNNFFFFVWDTVMSLSMSDVWKHLTK